MGPQDDLCIIDDDASVLDSTQALLASHGYRARTFRSAEEFLEWLADGGAPSCIVSDVRMGGMSGLELLEELKRRGNAAPLVLITGHGQIPMAVAAIRLGAEDFIEKPFDEVTLVGAIARAIERADRDAETSRQREAIRVRMADLSQRQREVLDLVVTGLSSKEVAARLGISPRTVETYRLWIMEKMDAKNLADLVRKVSRAEA